DEVGADKTDLDYLLAAARLTFPLAALGEKDVVSTFAGLRPLVYEAGKSLGETSREETIRVSEAGLLPITGGKLTTHRRMGGKARGLCGRPGGRRWRLGRRPDGRSGAAPPPPSKIGSASFCETERAPPPT